MIIIDKLLTMLMELLHPIIYKIDVTYLNDNFLGSYITCVFGTVVYCAYEPPDNNAIPSNNF